MNIKTICNYISELADKNPTEFGEYFYDDIRNYLNFTESTDENLESDMKELCGSKYKELIACKSKDDVKEWLDKISGNIIMKFDTESIIHEYFN
jgi:hypothetical protein